MRIVIFGLSITSSWGNGHATNYRALVRELAGRGHDVLFLERDMPWYSENRDLPEPPWGRTVLYDSLDELKLHFAPDVRDADAVIAGSFVPDGIAVTDWAQAHATGATVFYDIDTPITLAALGRGDCAYLEARQVPSFDLYLSFTGGPILERLAELGARRPLPFYCFVDPDAHRPRDLPTRWDVGYLGTYSDDREPIVQRLLVEPARAAPELRFVIAGPGHPTAGLPDNVELVEHVAPPDHGHFYASQRFTLNATRQAMSAAGWSPSVRLFEAAACAVPVISDPWEGLDAIFRPGEEIIVAHDGDDVLRVVRQMDETSRRAIGLRARQRVLDGHTAARRVDLLEEELQAVRRSRTARRREALL